MYAKRSALHSRDERLFIAAKLSRLSNLKCSSQVLWSSSPRVFLNTGKSDISRPWVRAPDKCHHRRRPSAATRTPKRGAVIRASKSRSTEFGLKILEHKTSANGYVPLSESPYSESIIVRSTCIRTSRTSSCCPTFGALPMRPLVAGAGPDGDLFCVDYEVRRMSLITVHAIT